MATASEILKQTAENATQGRAGKATESQTAECAAAPQTTSPVGLTQACLKVALALALACPAFALSGCGLLSEGKAAENPAKVAIVVQNTQGTPCWDSTVLDDCIAQVRASGGEATVTVADSNPTAIAFDFSDVAESQLNQDRLERQLHEALAQGADDPGADLLKAIEVAAQSVAGSNNILGVFVIASGISDTGLLQMVTSNLVEADATQVAEYYAAKNELPDVSWVQTVTWYGMGSTAGRQGAPSNAQKAAIEALYQAVLEKCGTTLCVQNVAVATSEEHGEDLPEVQVVQFAPVATFKAAASTETGAETEAGGTIEFSSTQLGFVGDGVEFADPAQATEALGAVAGQLAGNPGLMATVTCSAASYPWKEGYSQGLSEHRAAAVCEALKDMGVSESQLVAVGIGNGGDLSDIDPETGLQIPDKAAAKRKTVIQIQPAATA